MKYIFGLLLLVLSAADALACPDLAGKYQCDQGIGETTIAYDQNKNRYSLNIDSVDSNYVLDQWNQAIDLKTGKKDPTSEARASCANDTLSLSEKSPYLHSSRTVTWEISKTPTGIQMKQVDEAYDDVMLTAQCTKTMNARIYEWHTGRMISYAQDGNKAEFRLYTPCRALGVCFEKVLSTITLNQNGNELKISGRRDYHFDIIRNAADLSGNLYAYCWTDKGKGELGYIPATSGFVLMGFGIAATASLCAVLPGVPFLIGATLLPVDAIITGGSHLFHIKNVAAARKFRKMVHGQSSTVNKRVFDLLVHDISQL